MEVLADVSTDMMFDQEAATRMSGLKLLDINYAVINKN